MRPVRIKQVFASCGFSAFVGLMNFALAQPMGPPPGMKDDKAATPDPLVIAASRWDANRDGVFTCEEWKQYVGRIFTIADKNSDGFLDTKEFQQLGRIEPIFSGADMAYFDDNHDQRIGRKEFTDKPNPFFAKYDFNGDCRVTNAELKGSTGANRDRPMGGPPKGGAPGMGR